MAETNRIADARSADIQPTQESYRRAHCVVFHRTREAFGGLSNMAAGFPVRVNGVLVPTTEALYQACRFPGLPIVQDLIIRQASPMAAKMKSKPHRNETRADWDHVRVEIMRWCLAVKLAQHRRAFGTLLLSTGDRPIVEQSHKDRFWGAVPEASGETLTGCNVLGRLLVELRARLTADPAAFDRVEPPRIPDFTLFGAPLAAVVSARLAKG